MKSYIVYVHYLTKIEVEAENEKQAAELAIKNADDGKTETLDITIQEND